MTHTTTASGSNIIAERGVIASLIETTVSTAELNLNAECFTDPACRALFLAVKKLEDAGAKIDLSSVVETGAAAMPVVLDIYQEPHFDSALALKQASILRAARQRRLAREALEEGLRMLLDPAVTPDSACLAVSDKLQGIVGQAAGSATRSMLEAAIGVLEAKAHPENQPRRTPLGIAGVDRLLGGGFCPSDLVIIGARPAVGKSAFLLQIAVGAAAKGQRVLYVSMEMSEAQNAQRVLANVSGVPAARFTDGDALTDSENLRVSDGFQVSGLERIEHYARSTCHVSDIHALAARMKRTGGLDVVCVDYLGLLRPERDTGSRVNDVSQISRDLKALAMSLNVVVIAACQLNRDSVRTNTKPSLVDLRDSGSIEQDANTVIFLSENTERKPTNGCKFLALNVAKNRSSPRCTTELVFRGDVMRFTRLEIGKEAS